MTYQEFVSNREERRAAYLAIPRCAGCARTFESYGMKPEEGFACGGKIYCNADCHDQAEVAANEADDFNSLSDEY